MNAHMGGGKALVVAVAKYQHVTPLPRSVRTDATDFAALISDRRHGVFEPGNVHLLLDESATADGIRAAFARLAQSTCIDQPLLCYFSGHGHHAGSGSRERSWIVPFDGDLAQPDATCISARELLKLLQSISSRQQVLIIDACHAGAIGAAKSNSAISPIGPGKTLSAVTWGSGRAILSSSRPDEVSLVLPGARNSLFTTHLLAAMRGGAVDRGDGTIRVLDVFHHIAEQVPKYGSQHPVLRAEDMDSNFVLARRSLHPAVSPDPQNVEFILIGLYPTGPLQNAIWARAGGDVSRLDLTGNGRAQWHLALRQVIAGGDPTLEALLTEVSRDHPTNSAIAGLLAV